MAVRTDAGMLALWAPTAFIAVIDYDSWETHVHERLPIAVAAGDLVPINIGSDGSWGVRVASSTDGLSDRERECEVVTSEPYLLVVAGGKAYLSGLEDVGAPASAPLELALPDGRYVVRVTIIDWDREPGARGPDGLPTSTALPDFVVQVGPALDSETYRTNELTFDSPD